MKTKPYVPVLIAALIQKNILREALALLGIEIIGSPSLREQMNGIKIRNIKTGVEAVALPNNNILFTIAQLIELGYELGDLKYCPDCKKLKAGCDQEQREMLERQAQELEEMSEP